MSTEATSSRSTTLTFLIGLLILAGIVGLVIIDGNSKRAMAPVLTTQDPVPYGDNDVLSIELGEEVSIIVRVVASDQARIQGLSGTESLAQQEGLFFVFPTSDTHGIWMKDMNYAIDIIWLDDEFRVVHIAPDVAPETYPDVFRPEEPARYVLEVVAGVAARAELAVGDVVQITENATAFDYYDADATVRDEGNVSSTEEQVVSDE